MKPEANERKRPHEQGSLVPRIIVDEARPRIVREDTPAVGNRCGNGDSER